MNELCESLAQNKSLQHLSFSAPLNCDTARLFFSSVPIQLKSLHINNISNADEPLNTNEDTHMQEQSNTFISLLCSHAQKHQFKYLGVEVENDEDIVELLELAPIIETEELCLKIKSKGKTNDEIATRLADTLAFCPSLVEFSVFLEKYQLAEESLFSCFNVINMMQKLRSFALTVDSVHGWTNDGSPPSDFSGIFRENYSIVACNITETSKASTRKWDFENELRRNKLRKQEARFKRTRRAWAMEE